MIVRRQFLGSLAAVASVPLIQTQLFAFEPNSVLKWPSRVIETVPHNKTDRAPVVTGVCIQRNGNLLGIVGDDHYVCIYDLAKDKFIQHLSRHSDWVRAAKFSADGTRLATAGNDRKLFIWNTRDWKNPAIIKKHPEAIIDLAFSPDGSKIATVGFEQELRIYETATGDLIRTLTCPCPDNHTVNFSLDGATIAAGGRCGNVRIWDVMTGSKVAQYKAHQRRVRSIEFISQKQILSCGEDQIVKVTDYLNPTNVRSFPRHGSKLYDVALIGSGMLATAGSDNKIHVWALASGERVGSLKGHTGTVSSLDFNDTTLVSGSYDTHVRLWTMEQSTALEKTTQRNLPRTFPQRQSNTNDGWNRKIK